ncbi:hypothetical protein TIFTF001_047800 [Ficus carica]|uniref:Uncharacterized protein n=1 Tax=Ficus carica TaxID=3494 RepID=A0AA87YY78_FICCA|nr:hypothetical protein TIFTF001_047800 [Ficus carica]
MQSMRANRG